MRRILLLLALALVLQTSAGSAHAYTLWYSTRDAQVTGIQSGIARGPQGISVSTSSPTTGGYEFDLGLDVPSNVSVTNVQVCFLMTPPVTLLDFDTDLSSDQWTCASVPMTPHEPTAPFAIRVRVATNGNTTMTLSAVGLEVQPASVAVEAPRPPETMGLRPSFPNPASASTVIDFEVPAGESARLQFYDAGGRLIRTLDPGIEAAARRRVIWDARDESGRKVAAGVYFYRVVTSRATSDARRVAIVR